MVNVFTETSTHYKKNLNREIFSPFIFILKNYLSFQIKTFYYLFLLLSPLRYFGLNVKVNINYLNFKHIK